MAILFIGVGVIVAARGVGFSFFVQSRSLVASPIHKRVSAVRVLQYSEVVWFFVVRFIDCLSVAVKALEAWCVFSSN